MRNVSRTCDHYGDGSLIRIPSPYCTKTNISACHTVSRRTPYRIHRHWRVGPWNTFPFHFRTAPNASKTSTWRGVTNSKLVGIKNITRTYNASSESCHDARGIWILLRSTTSKKRVYPHGDPHQRNDRRAILDMILSHTKNWWTEMVFGTYIKKSLDGISMVSPTKSNFLKRNMPKFAPWCAKFWKRSAWRWTSFKNWP